MNMIHYIWYRYVFRDFYHHFITFVSVNKATSKKTTYTMYKRTVYALLARNPDAIMKNMDVKRLITRPAARTNWRLSVVNWSWKKEQTLWILCGSKVTGSKSRTGNKELVGPSVYHCVCTQHVNRRTIRANVHHSQTNKPLDNNCVVV